MVSRIAALYEQHRNKRLIEPFCGALAVTLGVLPDKAILNDVNRHPVNFYNRLKRGLKVSIEMLNDEDFYYRHRQAFNDLILANRDDSREAAELFYYLNRTGYNGLCRFNKRGLFNVPFGRYKNISYRYDFSEYAPVFKDWYFVNGDFELLDVTAKDFLYADPPYDVEFRQYTQQGFDWQDQVRLADWLARHRGPVVLSNQATERIIDLYEKRRFRIEILDAPRMISCTGDRARAKEILAYRNI